MVCPQSNADNPFFMLREWTGTAILPAGGDFHVASSQKIQKRPCGSKQNKLVHKGFMLLDLAGCALTTVGTVRAATQRRGQTGVPSPNCRGVPRFLCCTNKLHRTSERTRCQSTGPRGQGKQLSYIRTREEPQGVLCAGEASTLSIANM